MISHPVERDAHGVLVNIQWPRLGIYDQQFLTNEPVGQRALKVCIPKNGFNHLIDFEQR